MNQDEFLARKQREKALWNKHGNELLALAPGDLPEGASPEQRRIHARWVTRYRRVLSGELSVGSAMRDLRREARGEDGAT